MNTHLSIIKTSNTRLSTRVGRLVHGFDDREHKESVRQMMREVRDMEEALEWIIAPDRPIGSDAEMVYVMEHTARKILRQNLGNEM